MSKIKTRERVRDIKVLDKSLVAGERMKQAFIRSKQSTADLMDNSSASSSEYAESRVEHSMEGYRSGSVLCDIPARKEAGSKRQRILAGTPIA